MNQSGIASSTQPTTRPAKAAWSAPTITVSPVKAAKNAIGFLPADGPFGFTSQS